MTLTCMDLDLEYRLTDLPKRVLVQRMAFAEVVAVALVLVAISVLYSYSNQRESIQSLTLVMTSERHP